MSYPRPVTKPIPSAEVVELPWLSWKLATPTRRGVEVHRRGDVPHRLGDTADVLGPQVHLAAQANAGAGRAAQLEGDGEATTFGIGVEAAAAAARQAIGAARAAAIQSSCVKRVMSPPEFEAFK